ncbi:MAG: acetylornithine transaminase [Candidatus Nanopelagicales bacterium]
MAADSMPNIDDGMRWQSRWEAHLMNNYGVPPLTLERGYGTRVWDVDGQEYLDLLGGIAVNALGQAHPAIVAAVTAQLELIGHTSNLAITKPPVQLAEKLLALLDPSGARDGRILFSNSGAEANETAFKLSRLTGRTRVIVADQSFHGRTMGALALTAQPKKQEPFAPLPGDVTVVPFGDPAALVEAVTEDTAAVFLEPIQGEGGVRPAPEGYLATARSVTRNYGALLVIDEVQTGIGRTGQWFAHQADGIEPDVVTMAKGLGGGLPIGACAAFGDAGRLMSPGSHGTTFGGNPVSCAAALAVLQTIETDGLLANAQRMGAVLTEIVCEQMAVRHVRGSGLLLGVVLRDPMALEVELAARQQGVIVNAVRPDVVRLAPPLILSDGDAEYFAARWPVIVQQAAEMFEGSA